MREIKFRAWDKDEKLMKEVDSIHFPLGKPSGKDITAYNQESDYYEWIYNYELMQYTRLKDSNSKEIYEGDIVKIKFMTMFEDKGFIGVVKFYEGSFFVENEKLKTAHFLFREIDLLEVIGNIYENKELLE